LFLDHIEMLLAGPLAEAYRLVIAAGAPPTAAAVMAYFNATAAGQSDLTKARNLARALSHGTDGKARHLVRSLAWRGAARFVKGPQLWSIVSTLASSVLEHGELSGPAAMWVVRRAMRGMQYPALQDELRMWLAQPRRPAPSKPSKKLWRLC
jgi:hypothetical protein